MLRGQILIGDFVMTRSTGGSHVAVGYWRPGIVGRDHSVPFVTITAFDVVTVDALAVRQNRFDVLVVDVLVNEFPLPVARKARGRIRRPDSV
jgi:hypothetical protein